jgi:uncharacterized protein
VRTFLTAQWRDLVMLNYAIDPELLRGRVPRGVELDFHGGRTFVSVVGFRFLDTRVLGFAIPFHRNFPEVNLRFYVKRVVGAETRRGVVFIRELVPRAAIAWTARLAYNEPYRVVPMRESVVRPENGAPGSAEYRWRARGLEYGIRAEFNGDLMPLAPGSEEEFIAEHYWGYGATRGGSLVEYQVEHPPWRIWRTASHSVSGDLGAFYGEPFTSVLRRKPTSVFVAEGSEVSVSPVR